MTPAMAAAPEQADSPGEAAVLTHLYAFEREVVGLESFDGYGGAIESLGDELLVATPKGRFALVFRDGTVAYAEGRIPMNLAGLEAHEDYESPAFNPDRYRTADILVKEAGAGRYELFATHHYFTGECIRFRLSVTTLLRDEESITVLPNWRTIFEAEPCLPLRGFAGHEAGGKMLRDGAEHLLVLTGHHRWEGWEARPSFDTDNHMGKLLRIELESGEAEVLAIGFRNSQGLVRDAEGRLWAPDHGPQGGDELNLLERGGHYGWPLVTYGVEYGGTVPPEIEDAELGRHEGFRQPVYAWVPSPAVTAIAVNDERWFPLWKDDLLVASLKASSLFRVHRVGTEVRYVEKIEIGAGIRDITFLPEGRIALLLNGGRVIFLSRSPRYCDEEARERRDVYSIDCESLPPLPTASASVAEGAGAAGSADVVDGAQLYSTHCGSCHNLQAGQHGPGPHLVEVSGRRVGDELGGFRFSEALRALGGVWTRDKLRQYLADPQEFAPGTSMASPNISEAEAGAIVDYLHSLYPPGELVGDAAPAIAADFEVWLADGQLVYWRQDCAAEDVDAPFFLHIVPLDVEDLPAERQQYGFDSLDFDFGQHGTWNGKTCQALVSLPGYGIAEIRTGQYVARDEDFENLWTGTIRPA